jgi:hypothetical protein
MKDYLRQNFELLNSTVQQTKAKVPVLDATNWRNVLAAHCATLNWDQAIKDVLPFLERPQDRALLTKDAVLTLIEGGDSIGS